MSTNNIIDNVNINEINLINDKINELNKKINIMFKNNNSNNITINIKDFSMYKQIIHVYKLKYNLLKFFYILMYTNYYNYLYMIKAKSEKKMKNLKS